MGLRMCPDCKRMVAVLKNGKLCTHGPGSGGQFICYGSGDKGMVEAAKHLKVDQKKK